MRGFLWNYHFFKRRLSFLGVGQIGPSRPKGVPAIVAIDNDLTASSA